MECLHFDLSHSNISAQKCEIETNRLKWLPVGVKLIKRDSSSSRVMRRKYVINASEMVENGISSSWQASAVTFSRLRDAAVAGALVIAANVI